MTQENQKERKTINFVELNGFGSVLLKDGTVRDVFVHGYFTMWEKWNFIVHRSVRNPQYLSVSEASTGNLLTDALYISVEDALHRVLPFIEEKRYYFATKVSNSLVSTQKNLSLRNKCLTTLAIDTALWL